MNTYKSHSKALAIILSVCLLITAVVTMLYYGALKRKTETDIQDIRSLYATRTENLINLAFHKTDVMVAVASLLNGKINDAQFNALAKTIYSAKAGDRAVQYLPNGVTAFCYPMKGNEKAIGNNVLQMPKRRKDALLAVKTRSIALSGPYRLTQGGLGVVARNPIFLKNADGHEYFWGFAVIVLNLPQAIESVGLDQIARSGYDFQLFFVNENGDRCVIAGNPQLDTREALLSPIRVPHHEWTLALKPLHPYSDLLQALLIALVGVLTSVILSYEYITVLTRSSEHARNVFMSNVSHDMRTPLNAICCLSGLGAESRDAEESRAYHKKIYTAAKYLTALVSNILEISKGTRGELTLEPEPCQIASLLESARAIVSGLEKVQKLDIRFANRVPADVWARLDTKKLQRLCVILFSNAVERAPAGGAASFTAELCADDYNRRTLELRFADNGQPLGDKMTAHIFAPLDKHQQERTEGVTGTNSSLAIAQQYASLMGGGVRCVSSEGKGTEFIASLPLELIEKPLAATSAAADKQTDPLRGRRALVAEDNELNFMIVKKLLECRGITVDWAVNGKEALEKFKNSKPGCYDFILMDIMMPEMDGLSATKAIRSLKRADAAAIPIAALTANAFDDDVKDCLEAGINVHLSKPIDSQLLFDTLEKLSTDSQPERG